MEKKKYDAIIAGVNLDRIPDADVLAWYGTAEGADWLETAALAQLCGRQLWLIDHPSPTSGLEYALIEHEIRKPAA
jgi:hypothetical protein